MIFLHFYLKSALKCRFQFALLRWYYIEAERLGRVMLLVSGQGAFLIDTEGSFFQYFFSAGNVVSACLKSWNRAMSSQYAARFQTENLRWSYLPILYLSCLLFCHKLPSLDKTVILVVIMTTQTILTMGIDCRTLGCLYLPISTSGQTNVVCFFFFYFFANN